jgi:peroxiredoxin
LDLDGWSHSGAGFDAIASRPPTLRHRHRRFRSDLRARVFNRSKTVLTLSISPEKPDDTLSTSEKNALTFEVLSDVGQKVGRAFGLVYQFTEELKTAYRGFNLNIPARNGTPDEWALPLSATYVIDCNGLIVYAYTDVDYRDRADPRDVLAVLTRKAVAA